MASIELLFPSPIYSFRLRNLDHIHLVRADIEKMSTMSTNRRSAAGSALRTPDNFAGDFVNLPFAAELSNFIGACAKDYELSSFNVRVTYWGIVSPRYAYNTRHVHSGATLSGVVYLSAPAGAGGIIFCDPRPGRVMEIGSSSRSGRYPQKVKKCPEVGLVLIFPSWLEHEVEMSDCDEPRTILSFNVFPI